MMRMLTSFPLLAIFLAAMTSPVWAADTATLSALRQQQASVYAIVREFHMQTLLSGDPVRTEQLKTAVETMRKNMQGVPAKTGNAAADTAIGEARAATQRFTKLALANNITKDGFTDDNLVGELYQEADLLIAALGKAIGALPAAGKTRANADKAHATNLLVQRAIASYLKRSAQMTPDVGAEDSFDVGEAAKSIDKQMQNLTRELAAKNEIMHNVSTKWRFVSGSLINYNEKTVPFIMDRYASQINEGLLKVTAELDGK